MARASVWDPLVSAPLRARPRLTGLPSEASVLCAGQPGTHWRADTFWALPPRQASVSLTAVACRGQWSPAVLETQLKAKFCVREGSTRGFGVSFHLVRSSLKSASKLAQSSAEGERGSVSRLMGPVIPVMRVRSPVEPEICQDAVWDAPD